MNSPCMAVPRRSGASVVQALAARGRSHRGQQPQRLCSEFLRTTMQYRLSFVVGRDRLLDALRLAPRLAGRAGLALAGRVRPFQGKGNLLVARTLKSDRMVRSNVGPPSRVLWACWTTRSLTGTRAGKLLIRNLYQRASALTPVPVIARRAAPWQSRGRTSRFRRPLGCHAASAARYDGWVRAYAGWY